MWKRLLCTALLAHASFGVWAASDKADSYPSRPIRVLIGFPAGGAGDVMARIMGPKLTERFGQPIIVDNRPGATGNVAAEIAARANPDGHTLMLGSMTGLTSSPALYPKLAYDLLKDFSYVSVVATGAFVLVAHPSIQAKSVPELVALARSKPKAIRYGSGGVAGPPHLAMELLQNRAGVELLHVAYKGAAPLVIALAAGEVSVGFSSITTAMALINAKRLNALAVTGPKRSVLLPDVPTVAASGYPGYDVTNVLGILAPSGTPAAVVTVLNAEIRNVVQMEDIRAKAIEQGVEATASTPAEFRAMTQAEMTQWARLIKDARITAN